MPSKYNLEITAAGGRQLPSKLQHSLLKPSQWILLWYHTSTPTQSPSYSRASYFYYKCCKELSFFFLEFSKVTQFMKEKLPHFELLKDKTKSSYSLLMATWPAAEPNRRHKNLLTRVVLLRVHRFNFEVKVCQNPTFVKYK